VQAGCVWGEQGPTAALPVDAGAADNYTAARDLAMKDWRMRIAEAVLLCLLLGLVGCGIQKLERKELAVTPEEEIKRAYQLTQGELARGARPKAYHPNISLREQERNLAPLVRMLESKDIEERTQGTLKWQQVVDDYWAASQPALRRMVRHPQWQTRLGALLVLEFCHDPAGTDIVLEAIRDGEPMVRQSAAEALGLLGDGPKAIPALVEMSNDADAWVRKSVAAAFSMLDKDPRSEDVLLRLLKDPDGRVRGMSAEALALVGTARCGPALIEALRQDSEADVRQYAASALGFLQLREAVAALLEGLSDRSDDVRWASARSLGLCAEPKDEKVILALRRTRASDTALVRFAAEISLRKLGYHVAVETAQPG